MVNIKKYIKLSFLRRFLRICDICNHFYWKKYRIDEDLDVCQDCYEDCREVCY